MLRHWQVGELFSRIGEVDTIRGFLTETIATTVLNVLFAIIYLAALFSISPKLTLIVLIILPLQMGSLASVGPFYAANYAVHSLCKPPINHALLKALPILKPSKHT